MPTEILSEHYDEYSLAHTAATVSKTPLVINSKVVIPLNDAEADIENSFVYRAPKVRVAKAAAQAWVPGTLIYFSTAGGVFSTSPTSNLLCGRIAESADTADVEGIIDLDPAQA